MVCGRLAGREFRRAKSETSARLVYDIVDCPDYAQAESAQDIIVLVNEDGWKIDINETTTVTDCCVRQRFAPKIAERYAEAECQLSGT